MRLDSSADTDPPIPLSEVLALSEANGAASRLLYSRQLLHLRRALPLVIFALLGTAGGLAQEFARGGLVAQVGLWFGALLLAASVLSLTVSSAARIAAKGPLAASRVRAVAASAALTALIYNLLPLVAMTANEPPERIYSIIASELAMVVAGGFLLGPVPLAALAFLGVFALGYSVTATHLVFEGVSGPGVLVITAFIAAMVTRNIIAQASTLARSVRQVDALRSRGEVIGLLLHEFEQNSNDWLWESDAEMRITHVSARFSQISGLPAREALGRSVAEMNLSIDPAEFDEIQRAIDAKSTFRNIVLGVMVHGEQRWWSASGSPRFDTGGNFVGYIGIGSDVTEIRRNQLQIERMANSDGLTGLANRAVMRGKLQFALDGAVRAGGACSFLLIDLDRFKAINDTMGHPIGDELLREVARRLVFEIGERGTCARLGGDEFAVVLPATAAASARSLAERVISAVSEPYMVRGAQLRIGASVGIAEGPRDGSEIDLLIRGADLALYHAKSDGRGVARIYDPTLYRAAEERRALEIALRSALKNNELNLVFQPIFNLSTNEVRSFEALVRWISPTLGSIPPGRFIPIAEEMGIVDIIGEWVIRTACAWAARWPERIGVAVNLSPSQLVNPRLPGVVLHALAAHGVSPERLEVEITENVFLNESEATRAALAQLSSLGIRIGLDDFGTGYSSLGYLRNSVFNTIKIDRVFVRDAVDAESQSAEIVRHIVSLANNLGMETIAEGAETVDELDAVRRLGCGNVQGFYTGKPMQPEEATSLVGGRAIAIRAA